MVSMTKAAQLMKEFLKDLDMNVDAAAPGNQGSAALISFRLSDERKKRYDRLQERSGKRFGKRARELLEALIDSAEEIAS